MALPEYPPVRVQAPSRAGVGLRLPPGWPTRFAQPSWPADWWQRNYDQPIVDPDSPPPLPLTERQQRLPAPPEVAP